IAQRHLLPKQIEAVGLEPDDVTVPPETIRWLVRGYTREAGVRGLEREIASVLRKAARAKASGSLAPQYTVDLEELERLLGPSRFSEARCETIERGGVANGLPWSGAGGGRRGLEASRPPGPGRPGLAGRRGATGTESG